MKSRLSLSATTEDVFFLFSSLKSHNPAYDAVATAGVLSIHAIYTQFFFLQG